MPEVLQFIEARLPVIDEEIGYLKQIFLGMKNEDGRYYAICNKIALLEMRQNDLQNIKKMLTQ